MTMKFTTEYSVNEANVVQTALRERHAQLKAFARMILASDSEKMNYAREIHTIEMIVRRDYGEEL